MARLPSVQGGCGTHPGPHRWLRARHLRSERGGLREKLAVSELTPVGPGAVTFSLPPLSLRARSRRVTGAAAARLLLVRSGRVRVTLASVTERLSPRLGSRRHRV